jgi:hypothetical protein
MRQRHLLAFFLCIAFLMLCFASSAIAQTPPPDDAGVSLVVDAGASVPATVEPPKDAGSAIKMFYDAIVHHDWWLLAALALVGAGMVVNWGLTKKSLFFKRDGVRVVVVAIIAGIGGFLHAWMADVPPDVDTASASLKMFIMAAFAYMMKKKLASGSPAATARR